MVAKKYIADSICCVVNFFGLSFVLREVLSRNKVTIINYHAPAAAIFDRHAEYLSAHYNFVSCDEVVNALSTRDFSSLPPKSLLVTFDDGYASNHDLLPILLRHKIPAVIYVVAGLVGTKRRFWFDVVERGSAELECLKRMNDAARRQYLTNQYNHTDTTDYDEVTVLTYSQLAEFIALGGTVGSHTLYHPLLDMCEAHVAAHECNESKRQLERELGCEIQHFALPNGNSSPEILSLIRRLKYISCRTTEPGWVTTSTDPLRLPTFGVPDDASLQGLAARTSGAWSLLMRVWNSLLSVRKASGAL